MRCSRNARTQQGFASDLEGWIKVTLASIRLGFIRLFRMKVVRLFHLFFLEANVVRVMVVSLVHYICVPTQRTLYGSDSVTGTYAYQQTLYGNICVPTGFIC